MGKGKGHKKVSELEGLWRPCGQMASGSGGKPGQRERLGMRSPSQWAGRTGLKTRFLDNHQQADSESSDYGHSLLHLTTAVRMRIPKCRNSLPGPPCFVVRGHVSPIHLIDRHSGPLPALAAVCVGLSKCLSSGEISW